MPTFTFDTDKAVAFLDAMVDCNTIAEALKISGFCSSAKTVYTWLRRSERGDERFIMEWLETKEQFAEHYDYSYKLRAYRLSEEADEQARKIVAKVSRMKDKRTASAVVSATRIQQDYYKWITGIMNRDRFGKPNDQGAMVPIHVTLNIGKEGEVAKTVVPINSVVENNNKPHAASIRQMSDDE